MAISFFITGCAPEKNADSGDVQDTEEQNEDSGVLESDCPDGMICVDSFPWTGTADTTQGSRHFEAYGCEPGTDESGPEIIYRISPPEEGFLGVRVEHAEGVDIDVHILNSLDSQDCLSRGHWDAGSDVDAGFHYVIADSWVNNSGVEKSGEYTLKIGLTVPEKGSCEMESGWLDRVGDGGNALKMPATGPVVMEAHLVTVDDGYGPGSSDSWPQSITENIPGHHVMSEDSTGFVMHRNNPWAPQESSEFGQGSHGAKLPVIDESWYVNMYWSSRPSPGTKMIVMTPAGRAVVAAAGYETGPGNLDNIGGVTEEVHHYLGTGHKSEMTIGFAVDQSLALGPITCQ